ncbi:hypothetical protein IWQ60_009791 [Tieghemiomyces parasiticus]|uniref:Uncharacterized protein n=1 Tax=Tieghemiomyces parasiticus TaxID=78921 RepID=A0A9W8DNS4_9FUNG|nr:hypothetical protein IWQ60_009791 [Tieghemiomyces parasiticus]
MSALARQPFANASRRVKSTTVLFSQHTPLRAPTVSATAATKRNASIASPYHPALLRMEASGAAFGPPPAPSTAETTPNSTTLAKSPTGTSTSSPKPTKEKTRVFAKQLSPEMRFILFKDNANVQCMPSTHNVPLAQPLPAAPTHQSVTSTSTKTSDASRKRPSSPTLAAAKITSVPVTPTGVLSERPLTPGSTVPPARAPSPTATTTRRAAPSLPKATPCTTNAGFSVTPSPTTIQAEREAMCATLREMETMVQQCQRTVAILRGDLDRQRTVRQDLEGRLHQALTDCTRGSQLVLELTQRLAAAKSEGASAATAGSSGAKVSSVTAATQQPMMVGGGQNRSSLSFIGLALAFSGAAGFLFTDTEAALGA